MRSGLFFLSVGLLALGANLPRTFGQKDPEKLAFLEAVILSCLGEGLPPDSSLRWFRNDEAVPTSIKAPKKTVIFSTLTIHEEDLEGEDFFTCLVEPKVFPPLTGQKTQDKDSGHRASNKTFFQEDEAKSAMTLSCLLEGSRPAGVDIVWEENRSPLPEEAYDNYEDIYSIHSVLTVPNTARSFGNTYSCIVGQQGLIIRRPPPPS